MADFLPTPHPSTPIRLYNVVIKVSSCTGCARRPGFGDVEKKRCRRLGRAAGVPPLGAGFDTARASDCYSSSWSLDRAGRSEEHSGAPRRPRPVQRRHVSGPITIWTADPAGGFQPSAMERGGGGDTAHRLTQRAKRKARQSTIASESVYSSSGYAAVSTNTNGICVGLL